MKLTLNPGQLTFADLRCILDDETSLQLHPDSLPAIYASQETIKKIILDNKVVYGVNTGFGALASTQIPLSDLETLQRRIVLSHAAGVGELLSDQAVRLILALKINSLARGYSGVRMETIDALIRLFNAKIYPCIPSKGSVGASGDLAPLAHLSAILLGIGHARHHGTIISAEEALSLVHLQPLKLAPKEGLALLNGTQVSTALAMLGLFSIQNVFTAAMIAGSLSVDAAKGSDSPFDERIQIVRGHDTQIEVARIMRDLLANSEIRKSHQHCKKIQDPYSLRCQPQVMGAFLSHILHASHIILTEANAVSDNPLVFASEETVISGGNFHAEPIAFAADALAISIAEIGALSERRIALLVDPHFSGLPAFLVNNPGINSGFMIAQVTAAALASENKSLAHPASVDSIPTSANQEDHVSMATYAARRLITMAENTASIIGIELLAATQGIDFARPLKTSYRLEKIYQLIRKQVPYYDEDRYFSPDIQIAQSLVLSGELHQHAEISLDFFG
jgi:histidine ammonia-lyase